MTRKKVGVDFDDVVLDCNTSLALFHNKHYGTSFERKDVQSFDLTKLWHCTEEEMAVRIKGWYNSPEHAESRSMPGAVEAIRKLAASCELHIITARSSQVQGITSQWIAEHLPGVFSGIHFTNRFAGGRRPKSEVCRELEISVLIDDSIDNARDVAASEIPVLLFDAPWNQEEIPPGVTRVFSWEEVLKFFASYV